MTTQTNDILNGCFELLGGIILILNVVQLYKDKCVQGFSPIPTIFFTTWGIWNLHYYSSLNQWFSFIGGILIATINSIWLIQIYYYTHVYNKENL